LAQAEVQCPLEVDRILDPLQSSVVAVALLV
jgi:hypothetical protein